MWNVTFKISFLSMYDELLSDSPSAQVINYLHIFAVENKKVHFMQA